MSAEKVKLVVDCITAVAGDKGVQKLIFGQYTDGTPRSIVDAMNGEFESAKTKRRKESKKKKKKKKKKHYDIF